MTNAHIRKIFPGAVTANGFFSYYNYIIESDAQHIFVIKGGPGVGKSTFMKKIGESMLTHGYDIEYHCCSSDNDSIDGIVVPALGIALLDGTAPHVVDPKNPGAVDEIINLGEFWDEKKMKQAKREILDCNYQIGRYFQCAYFALNEAKIALSEWEFYISAYQNWERINGMTLEVESKLFSVAPKSQAAQRHLFAWAHTPQGKTQHIDTLLLGVETLYTLTGQPGTGKSTFLLRIAERAKIHGYACECFHNTLDPVQLDLVIIPDLKTALVVIAEPYEYSPNFLGNIINLDFNQFLNTTALQAFDQDINDCRRRVDEHISRAISNSQRAKKTHDLMETYYIPAMDFAAIEKKRLSTLARIFSLASQQEIAITSSPPPVTI